MTNTFNPVTSVPEWRIFTGTRTIGDDYWARAGYIPTGPLYPGIFTGGGGWAFSWERKKATRVREKMQAKRRSGVGGERPAGPVLRRVTSFVRLWMGVCFEAPRSKDWWTTGGQQLAFGLETWKGAAQIFGMDCETDSLLPINFCPNCCNSALGCSLVSGAEPGRSDA